MICKHCNKFKVHSFYSKNYCSKQCYLVATKDEREHIPSSYYREAEIDIKVDILCDCIEGLAKQVGYTGQDLTVKNNDFVCAVARFSSASATNISIPIFAITSLDLNDHQ